MLGLLALAVVAIARGDAGVAFAGGWGLRGTGGDAFVAGIALVLDGLSRLFLLLVAVVGTAAAVYALRYLAPEAGRPLFHVLFNLLVAGMNGALLAGDLFNLYVFVEVASVASYGLVAYRAGGTEVEAAFKYLVLGTLASTAILLGTTVLYAATGYLNMADLSAAIAPRRGRRGLPLLFASGLFVLGFGTKTAAMPFHAWLPDAHPSAPAPISAMLSGLLIKTLGIYALVRVFSVVVGFDDHVRTILTVLGLPVDVGRRAARPGAGRPEADPRVPLGEPDGLRPHRARARHVARRRGGAVPRHEPRPLQVGALPVRRLARAGDRHAPAVGHGRRVPARARDVGGPGGRLSLDLRNPAVQRVLEQAPDPDRAGVCGADAGCRARGRRRPDDAGDVRQGAAQGAVRRAAGAPGRRPRGPGCDVPAGPGARRALPAERFAVACGRGWRHRRGRERRPGARSGERPAAAVYVETIHGEPPR